MFNKINISSQNYFLDSNQSKRSGFTLLEILLVIAAIGILAAIVVVAINPIRQIEQVRDSQRASEVNNIGKAVEQFNIDTGNYPSSIIGVQREICQTGTETTGGPTDCSNRVDLRGLVPTYMAAIPSSGSYSMSRSNGGNGRVHIQQRNTRSSLSCPSGYIRVPGNPQYSTRDFCVMKYEAKAVGINNPSVGLTTPSTPRGDYS